MEVRTNLDHMLGFAVACDDLAQYITDQLALSNLSRQSAGSATATRSRPATPASGPQRVPATSLTLSNITRRTSTQHAHFQQSTQLIISRLEKHSNLVVRDLSTRLNFNSFYHTASRKGVPSTVG